MARTSKKSGFKQAGVSADGTLVPVRVVAGYIRVSTDEQAKSGLGLGDQRHRITAMAAVKGWPEPIWYSDEGISGAKDTANRKGLARLLADVESGQVQAVITLDISRIARRMRVFTHVMDTISQAGALFVSCKESFDTSTPQGYLALNIFALFAQFERELIAQRVRAAVDEHDRRDGERGGGMPYGYLREPETKRPLIEPTQARIVRRIFKLRAEGATLRAIAAELNRRKYPSPHGKRWHHSSVQVVLLNEAYYHGGKRGASEVRWPVILKDDEAQSEA